MDIHLENLERAVLDFRKRDLVSSRPSLVWKAVRVQESRPAAAAAAHTRTLRRHTSPTTSHILPRRRHCRRCRTLHARRAGDGVHGLAAEPQRLADLGRPARLSLRRSRHGWTGLGRHLLCCRADDRAQRRLLDLCLPDAGGRAARDERRDAAVCADADAARGDRNRGPGHPAACALRRRRRVARQRVRGEVCGGADGSATRPACALAAPLGSFSEPPHRCVA